MTSGFIFDDLGQVEGFSNFKNLTILFKNILFNSNILIPILRKRK